MRKKVMLISPFVEDISTSRPFQLFTYFTSTDHETIMLYSDFSHSMKAFRKINVDGFIGIPVMPYYANISLRRFFSHFLFSFSVIRHIVRFKPDIIVINLPPNILSWFPVLYRIFCRNYLVVDVIDLWPESFPIPLEKKKLFLRLVGWSFIMFRKMAVRYADRVLTQSSEFYQEVVKKYPDKVMLVGLKKSGINAPDTGMLSDVLSICYIGNIGHIYDFDSLVHIASEVKKHRPIRIEIIGRGEKLDELTKKLTEESVDFVYHGAIYEDDRKNSILSSCWFGYNGYLQTTSISTSYKFVEYISCALPIINSAFGDTWNTIENNKLLGYNFSQKNTTAVINKLQNIDVETVKKMRSEAFAYFNDHFSADSLQKELRDCF